MFLIIHQNNSGGYFHENEYESPIVVVECTSADEGISIARQYLDNSDSCPCCGDRWSFYWDEDELVEDWKSKVGFSHFNTSILLYRKDGKRVRYTEAGNVHNFLSYIPISKSSNVKEEILN